MKRRNIILKNSIFLLVLQVPLWAFEITSASHAVDIAGKQRMFTQNMLKNYTMIGMNNQFGNPSKELITLEKDFEEHLNALILQAKTAQTKESLTVVHSLWIPILKILKETPSKEKVAGLQKSLDTLLKASDTATQAFAKESGTSSAQIVNMSGKQRMLSQRMASLYMLKVWGIDDPQFEVKLQKSMDEFKTSLGKLEQTEINTDEINKELKKVKRAFMYFEMMSKSKSKYTPSLIYKKSNDILQSMNSVTHAYVALENK